ncbi:MAG: hypothetical protein JSV35_00285 [Candidatus Bathyarchaeota archaeon]|nr:MAG: hypothetical protein JSV35_00285 [Candidatus Bathyarchaeota archaeon]
MEVERSERRIISSLILLAGVTLLSMAVYTGQLAQVLELIKGVFEPAIAGLP